MFIGVIVSTFNNFYKNHILWWRTYPGSAPSAPSLSFALSTAKMQINFNCAFSSLSHQGEKIAEEAVLRIPLYPLRLNGNTSAGFLKKQTSALRLCWTPLLPYLVFKYRARTGVGNTKFLVDVSWREGCVEAHCWRRAWFFDMPTMCTSKDYIMLIFKGATSVTLFSVVLRMCNRHGDLNLSLDFCSEIP